MDQVENALEEGKTMKVIIMGCGRVGSRLARLLDGEGHQVIVIDLNAGSFRRLGDGFRGTTVLGTGIDEEVLSRAGIQGADVFVATTEGDNRNLMAAQVAQKVYKVPRVMARTYDVGRSEVFASLGIKTFCPTLLGASILHEMIQEKA